MQDQILDRIKAGERFPVLTAIGYMIRCINEAANSQKTLDADKLINDYQPLKNNSVTYNGIERRKSTAVCN